MLRSSSISISSQTLYSSTCGLIRSNRQVPNHPPRRNLVPHPVPVRTICVTVNIRPLQGNSLISESSISCIKTPAKGLDGNTSHAAPKQLTQAQAYRTTQQLSNMSDDASYMAFLNKANEDPKSGTSESTSQTKSKFDPTTTSNSALPSSLQSIPDTLTYTSDTDSPFEAVVLNYSGDGLPDQAEFKKALGAKADQGDVEELTVHDFDPRGQYTEIIDRVKSAGDGKGVKVFRVEVGATRVEYYIVTLGDRKLVGVYTKAVES